MMKKNLLYLISILFCNSLLGQECIDIIRTTAPTVNIWDWRIADPTDENPENYTYHILDDLVSNHVNGTNPFYTYNATSQTNVSFLQTNFDIFPILGLIFILIPLMVTLLLMLRLMKKYMLMFLIVQVSY